MTPDGEPADDERAQIIHHEEAGGALEKVRLGSRV